MVPVRSGTTGEVSQFYSMKVLLVLAERKKEGRSRAAALQTLQRVSERRRPLLSRYLSHKLKNNRFDSDGGLAPKDQAQSCGSGSEGKEVEMNW